MNAAKERIKSRFSKKKVIDGYVIKDPEILDEDDMSSMDNFVYLVLESLNQKFSINSPARILYQYIARAHETIRRLQNRVADLEGEINELDQD